MRRGPTTFALIFALLVLALVLALTLASWLMLRVGALAIADRYAPMVVATAMAADLLAEHGAATGKINVQFSSGPPGEPATRSALVFLARNVADLLGGDASRVVATQSPESRIWIRSGHDPKRWIVLPVPTYRMEISSSLAFAMLAAGLLALLAATIAARLLTRPLERLSKNAGALLNGETNDNLLRGSPREVRSLAVAIGDAGERLREAARERELMLAGVSHDLRTPLTRLRIALELGDAADAQRRMDMVDDLEQLDNALEQCLAFVRDGRDEALREIDVAAIAGQLIGLRAQADAWQLDAPASLSAAVRPTLLRRALANLMDNAERHGAAPFALGIARTGERLAITVCDHGPGVASDLLERIGQPFTRGDAARGGNGGAGLGLSIVTRIVRMHGGEVRFRNRDGGGFEARIELPLAASMRSPAMAFV